MKKHIYTIALSLLTAVMMVGCQEGYSPVDNIPVVETTATEDVRATKATLYGVITKEAYRDFNFSYYEEQAPHYFFLLSQYEDLTDSTRVEARRDSDTCYAEVSGLTPATTYYYALCVANDYSMVMGEVQSLTTGKNTIIEVTTLPMVMEAVTKESAPLEGSFKAETDCEAFFLLSETSTFENSWKVTAVVNNGSCFVWVEGLTQGTTYYYKLSVFDQYNNTMEGGVQSFTTKEEVIVEITYDQITPGQLVDLGLSVMWAGWNVGATSPEGLGGYYAWGEVEEKDDYSEKSHLYYNMDKDSYVNIGTDITGSEYDVAHMLWGDDWRMPTLAEAEELVKNCTFQWASLEGTKGCHITGPNGNSIFLPAAGRKSDAELGDCGSQGFYWIGELSGGYSPGGYYLYGNEDGFGKAGGFARSLGFSIRPVKNPKENEVVVAEAIDLGLSVKWASHNVGATAPGGYGGYYAWGETEEKNDYNWETYKWCNGSYGTFTKYCTESYCGTVDNKTVLDPEDDVAHVNWGDGWRMPTLSEMQELLEKCTREWTTVNGVNGFKFIGPNDNSIFLPATKYMRGYYWSASLCDYLNSTAYGLEFGVGVGYMPDDCYSHDRYVGQTVRPVYDSKDNNSDVDLEDYPEDENWDARRRR